MSALVNILVISLTAAFFSIPFLNRYVFRTANIDAIVEEGRNGLGTVHELINRGEFDLARDSARVLVERFRNDSLEFFTADVTNWNSVTALLGANRDDFATAVLVSRLDRNLIDSLAAEHTGARQDSAAPAADDLDVGGGSGDEVGTRLQWKVVDALNAVKRDLGFYVMNAGEINVNADEEVGRRHQYLVDEGVVRLEDTEWKLKRDLSEKEKVLLRRFHMVILENLLYPRFLEKDLKRNTDWASEYIVQTAWYFIGTTYRGQFQLDRAVEVYDSLVTLYPSTIYAEEVFLQVGRILHEEGRNALLAGETDKGTSRLERAVGYLAQIEKNRAIARRFPKYKYTDLRPGTYVNIDASSRAKRKIKEETNVYTLEQQKQEIEGKDKKEQSGHTLEDAVKLIGECYTLLGKTDSARAQFELLLDFFPESDNLDDAQKLIADSYVRDGDLVLDGADTSDAAIRSKAVEFYERGVREYQRFVNVYPQSDLVSKVYIALGDVYYKLGRAEDAAESFESALELAKRIDEKAGIQLEIGNYFYERRQYTKAVHAYKVILTDFLGTDVAPNAQYLLGNCYRALGDTAESIEAYKRLVKLYKDSKFLGGAAYKVGTYYLARANYKEAKRYFGYGYTYDTDGPMASRSLFQLGMVWVRVAEEQEAEEQIRSYKEAIKRFREVVERFRGTAYDQDADKAALQLASCYMRIDNEKAARAAAKQIRSRAKRIESLTIFGVGSDDASEELAYWNSLIAEAREDEERATALYEKAVVLTDKIQDHDAALEVYREILELTEDPTKKINARIGISRAYTATGDHAGARDVLLELLENKKLLPRLRRQLRIQLYDAYFSLKEFDRALDGFEGFAVQLPDHELAPYALYRAGAVLAQQGKHEKALETMRSVLESYPGSSVHAQAVLGVGEQMIALGRAEEAVEYLLGYLHEEGGDTLPAAPNIYLRVAETYRGELKNNRKALEIFDTLVAEYPEGVLYSYAAYQRGMLLREAGRDDEARRSLELVKKERKTLYRAAQAEIAKILAKTDPEAAIKNYRAIVEESETPEDSAIAMIGIGDVYARVEKWDEAAGVFEQVCGFYDGKDTTLLAGALVKWVDALSKDRQHEKAIEAAQILQQRFPDNEYTVNAVYFEGAAWFALKRYSRAREKFSEVIERDSSGRLAEVASYQKGDTYFFSDRFTRAIRSYDEYLRKYPDGEYAASAVYMQGNAYWSMQDFAAAGRKFRMVVNKYPSFPDYCNAKKSLAFCEDKEGNWRKAQRLYTEIIGNQSCPAEAVTFAREQREKIYGQH